MEEGVVVHDGDLITFTTAEDILGTAQKVFMKYQNFPNDVNPGERILLDDGKLILKLLKLIKIRGHCKSHSRW
jgi:pyruvate kinase